MRPLRTYWHWFLGTALVFLLPMTLLPLLVLMDRGLLRNPNIYWVELGMILSALTGMMWLGWAYPVIEFRYFREWRPSLPAARRSMIILLYLPEAIFAFLIHYNIWGHVIADYFNDGVLRSVTFSAAAIAWIVASFAGIALTWQYHLWYCGQYLDRCHADHLCAACGYDLRINPTGPCPECGARP